MSNIVATHQGTLDELSITVPYGGTLHVAIRLEMDDFQPIMTLTNRSTPVSTGDTVTLSYVGEPLDDITMAAQLAIRGINIGGKND